MIKSEVYCFLKDTLYVVQNAGKIFKKAV